MSAGAYAEIIPINSLPFNHAARVHADTGRFLLPVTAANLTDTIPPVINCPPGDTITLASGECDTNYTYTVTAFDSLTELAPVLREGLASGEPFPIGVTVNVFEVSDSAGNTATCSFTVVVAPAATTLACAQDTVDIYLGPGCTVAPAIEDLLAEPYGCLGDHFVIEADTAGMPGNGPWVEAVFGAADVNNTYMFRVTDTLNDEICLGFIRIQDSLVLALECPDINVPCALPLDHLAPDFLKDSLGISAGRPLVKQTCPNPVSPLFMDVLTDLPCDSPGIISGYIRRFWTVVDAANNVATCVQTINRERDLASVVFPADAVASCAAGNPSAETTGEPFILFGGRQYPLSAAPLCEIEVTYADSAEALCGGSRRLYRNWTLRDTCSVDSTLNTRTGVQQIEVLDLDGPQFQCAGDTAAAIVTVDCKGALLLPGIIAGDGCSQVTGVKAFWTVNGIPDSLEATLSDFPGNDPALPDTLAAFDTVPDFPAGVTQIVYVATDACGNTASCEIALSVWDSMPPAAVCDSFLVVTLDTSGRFSLPAGLLDDGSSDSCGLVSFKARRLLANGCQPVNRLYNAVDFCCTDVGDTVLVQLRAYDVLLPAGEVDTAFAAGQSANCTVQVWVQDTFPPFCMAPPNVTVACDSFDLSLAAYGDPVTACGIDSMLVEVDYAQFDSACNAGTITRTFLVFKAGNSGLCAQEIQVDAVQNYWVRFPNDTIVTMCDTSGVYGMPEIGNVHCENMSITYTDERITDAIDACLKIVRTWKIVNECTYTIGQPLTLVPNPTPNADENDPENFPGPVVAPAGTPDPWAPTRVRISPADPDSTDFSLFWPAAGYLYEQVIKVVDSEAPVFENCPSAALLYEDVSSNDPLLWNDSYTTVPGSVTQDLCEGEVALEMDITDACYGADVDARYLLFLDLDGDGAPETVINSDNPPSAGDVLYNNINTPNYGGGIPKIMDGRQVSANAKYRFSVQHLVNGFQKTVRVAWNTPGAPFTYTAPQLPLGNHRIEWIIFDGCGNEATCNYEFSIEDAGGLCVPAQLPLSGLIRTETGAGVNNVAVALEGTHPALPPFNLFDLTDDAGAYDFVVPTGSGFSIKPFRSDDPLNGVSTFDLFLINKHVLGLELLSSPYKIIAADANRSNTVSTFDIVELRKLVLGLYQELPNVPSWRFVDARHVFPNQLNPIQGGFPDSVYIPDMQPWTPSTYDFTAVKVGDVNGSANPGFAGDDSEDRAVLSLRADNRLLRPGQTALIPVRLTEAADLAGMQFALQFDPERLSVQQLLPGAGLEASGSLDAFYALPEPGVLTVSWNSASNTAVKADEPLLYLEVKTLQALELAEAIQLTGRRLKPEVYLKNGTEIRALQLEFAASTVAATHSEIFPASPNPSDRQVYIPLLLAGAENVRVQVYDPAGRQLYSFDATLPAGFHRLEIPAAAFGQMRGVALYRVQVGTVEASGKIVRRP